MRCGTFGCENPAVVVLTIKTPRMYAAGQYPACHACWRKSEDAGDTAFVTKVRVA